MWSRSAKKDRYRSRISSERHAPIVTRRRCRTPRPRRPATGTRSARSGAVAGLGELERKRAVAARRRRAGDPAGDGPRAVAELDGVDLGARAVQDGAAHGHRAPRERGARADRDRVGARVGGEDVERLAGRDAEPAALPDRVEVVAAVAAELAPGRVEDRAGALAHAAVAGEERRPPGAGEEAEVLRVGLLGDRQRGLAGDRAHLRLGELAEREPQPGERGGRERGERVRLVLRRVGRRAQQPVGRAARVVARGEVGGAERVRQREHGVEADVAVAAHAGVRRVPRRVLGDPRLDHAGPERGPLVEREVRQAHPVRERAGVADGARRAARGARVVLGVGPQLERHRDGRAPGAGAQQRGDRRVDAAAHRDEGAGRVGFEPCAARRRAERAVQRVGGEVGRVQLARREAAELTGDGGGGDARRGEQRRARDERDGRRAGRRQRTAALGVEAGGADPIPVDAHRDADEVAADRAAGGAVAGAVGPLAQARGRGEVLREALHAASVGAGVSASCACRSSSRRPWRTPARASAPRRPGR